MAVVPEERREFRQRFEGARKDENGVCCNFFVPNSDQCAFEGVRMQAVSIVFGCQHVSPNMFPESGLQLEFLNEFKVMGMILNRTPLPAGSTGDGVGWRVAGGDGASCNVVCHVLSCDPEDNDPQMDDKYRTALLFLPQCGVYCHRDRHVGNASVPGTLRAFNMSWLRLRREV